jgi:radical SAM superfamily enzyme YgiQ (UPF0313 family)
MRPRLVRREPGSVVREIGHWHDRGVSRFALYDDGFLADARDFAKPLLAAMGRLPFDIAVYNPNALNASLIDGVVARLLWEAGFREVRLGLETIDPALQKATGGKVDPKGFARAVAMLRHAGFPPGAVQAYVLAGLPLQRWEDVRRTIDHATRLGVHVHLAQYTPIPHTRIFERYKALARYPIAEEPLFQNNALFPFAWEGFTEADLNGLKAYARQGNEKIRPGGENGGSSEVEGR